MVVWGSRWLLHNILIFFVTPLRAGTVQNLDSTKGGIEAPKFPSCCKRSKPFLILSENRSGIGCVWKWEYHGIPAACHGFRSGMSRGRCLLFVFFAVRCFNHQNTSHWWSVQHGCFRVSSRFLVGTRMMQSFAVQQIRETYRVRTDDGFPLKKWSDMRVSKNRGVSPQIIHLFIGFSIIFTIHFHAPSIFRYPYFWKQPYNGNPQRTMHSQSRILSILRFSDSPRWFWLDGSLDLSWIFLVGFFRDWPYMIWLVATQIFFIFTPWGNDPIWRAYFSNGLKPPTSDHWIRLILLTWSGLWINNATWNSTGRRYRLTKQAIGYGLLYPIVETRIL